MIATSTRSPGRAPVTNNTFPSPISPTPSPLEPTPRIVVVVRWDGGKGDVGDDEGEVARRQVLLLVLLMLEVVVVVLLSIVPNTNPTQAHIDTQTH